MIVYVESNFVLELAFLQEEHESCESLLSLAESSQIQLVVPAFSMGEPYEALIRRSRRRIQLHEPLARELRELSRSEPYEQVVDESNKITDLLLRSGEEEKHRLDNALNRILESSEVIPLEASIIRSAIQFQETLSLSPQDSIVYTSVVRHLASSDSDFKCFLNKNSKDFFTPDIQEELSSYNCRLIPSFENGLRYVETQLG